MGVTVPLLTLGECTLSDSVVSYIPRNSCHHCQSPWLFFIWGMRMCQTVVSNCSE